VLALALGCGGSKPSSTPVAAAPACVSYEDAKREEQAIARRNEASFQRALAEQGLREADFPTDYFDARDDAGHAWQVVDAAAARTLLAPPSYMTCGVSNPWRLAIDGTGGVSALIVTGRETSSKMVTICGCHGDLPVTCGGAGPRPVRWRWAMTTATEWKGPMTIVVDHESMLTSFAGRANGAPCPITSPPP
jgi:hypothetical protein